jgi:hypothetical protein
MPPWRIDVVDGHEAAEVIWARQTETETETETETALRLTRAQGSLRR